MQTPGDWIEREASDIRERESLVEAVVREWMQAQDDARLHGAIRTEFPAKVAMLHAIAAQAERRRR
jgi:hypothetical protein